MDETPDIETGSWVEDRFRDFLELSPDAVVIADQHGLIVAANPQLEALFGYTPDEIVGKRVEVLVPESVRAGHVGKRNSFFESPRKRPMGIGLDLYGLRKDGTEIPVEISLGPLVTEHGTYVLSAIRDASARKAIEYELQRFNAELEQRVQERTAELARSNTELQQFAYVASHDLQEPLRMVASYTQLLARRYKGRLDSDADDFIAFAVEGANRMQRLINDLLAYSRVGTKGKSFEPVDPTVVLGNVLSDLHLKIDDMQAVVTHSDLPIVLADQMQMGQLLQNLVANALKFRGESQPRIHISAETVEGKAVFCVEDNGIGLDEEFAQRIFVIFQRLHGPDKYEGSGIGLAICKKIVERHGGKIWVESKPGAGARFFFTMHVA